MSRENDLEQIRAISDRAQTVWYSLLAVFLYLAVTAASVVPSDFFVGDRQVKLPLIDVAVPAQTFFILAPVLATILYAHFHLFQVPLWRLLGAIESNGPEGSLGARIPPWQLTSAAWTVRSLAENGRNGLRMKPDPFAVAASVAAILSAWALGPVALAYFWWVGLLSRDRWVVGLGTLSIGIAATVGMGTAAVLWREMSRERSRSEPRQLCGTHSAAVHPAPYWPGALFAGLLFAVVLVASGGTVATWRRLDLRELGKYQKPLDWLPDDIAFAEFRAHWCEREKRSTCDAGTPELLSEWHSRRRAIYGSAKPVVFGPSTEMAGADLSESYLLNTLFDGTDLRGSNLSYATLLGLQARGGASFAGANLDHADISYSILDSPDLRGALILRPRMVQSVISQAGMVGALLIGGRYPCGKSGPDTDLTGLQPCDPNMAAEELLDGLPDGPLKGGISVRLLPMDKTEYATFGPDTIISNADLDGAALRFMGVKSFIRESSGTGIPYLDASRVFADGSVAADLPDGPPCHWPDAVLGDKQFFGQWRGFLEASGFATWPPSAAIGDLVVADNVYSPLREGDDFTDGFEFARRALKVRDVPAIELPDCSARQGRPCFERWGAQIDGDFQRVCEGYSLTAAAIVDPELSLPLDSGLHGPFSSP